MTAWQKKRAEAARAPLERALRDLVDRLEALAQEARGALRGEKEDRQ